MQMHALHRLKTFACMPAAVRARSTLLAPYAPYMRCITVYRLPRTCARNNIRSSSIYTRAHKHTHFVALMRGDYCTYDNFRGEYKHRGADIGTHLNKQRDYYYAIAVTLYCSYESPIVGISSENFEPTDRTYGVNYGSIMRALIASIARSSLRLVIELTEKKLYIYI